ncbi:MAG TPA: ribonuclease H [Kofleriaceae bacterium]|jgi:ribonuclease HI
MPWLRHRLRDSDVWAKVDPSGALVADSSGRVEVLYKAEAGGKVYRAAARNLAPVPGSEPIDLGAEPAAPAASVAPVPADAIHVWTDGACTGNPGPAGLGVVIIDGANQRELSEYLGEGTNNIAELMAILRGLEEVRDRSRTVVVYSDSQYSIGLLTKPWKAKANVELVAKLRGLTKQFPQLRFVKVAGHAGIPLNERVDELAREAVQRRR